jgi:hypothetical protein
VLDEVMSVSIYEGAEVLIILEKDLKTSRLGNA